jgi:hydrogenase expression/formation protein HypC
MCLAIPGEIQELYQEGPLRFGKVKFGGVTRKVCLEYVPEAGPGDFVLVHVGFAISHVDREEAERTLRLFDELEAAMDGQDEEPGP